MDNNKVVTDLIISMHKDVGVMKSDMAAVKKDVEMHIKRTAMLEVELRYVHKHIVMVKGVGAFLGVIAVIASIYRAAVFL